MAKNEYKIQVSKKYDNGIIWLVRGDDLDELMKGLSFVRTFLSEESLLAKDSPVAQQQDKEYSQDPEDFDPSFCYIHDVPMGKKDGQYGAFYSHKTDDEAYPWNEKYECRFCNGRPPKGS